VGAEQDAGAVIPPWRNVHIDVDNKKDAIMMQVVQWVAEDYNDEYRIKMYGVNEAGASICVNVTNFTPFFMIKIPHKINGVFIDRLMDTLRGKMPTDLREHLLGAKILKKKEFWGFTNEKTFTFVRFTFSCLAAYRSAIRFFSYNTVFFSDIHKKETKYKLYESNIEPMLRFMHIKDISSAGWVQVDAGNYYATDEMERSDCQIDVTCHWKYVKSVEHHSIAPLVVASFDIECTSSHGDFPVARKDYKKVAFELTQIYKETPYTCEELVNGIRAATCTDLRGKENTDLCGPVKLSAIYTKEEITAEYFDTILAPKLYVMGDDLLNILNKRLVLRPTAGTTKKTSGGWKDVRKGQTASIDGMAFVTVSRDDERSVSTNDIINSLTRKLGCFVRISGGGNFGKPIEEVWVGIMPEVEGDPVIQIGTTVHRYGEKDCIYKNIISLGECASIDGVDVVSCATEAEVLIEWRNLIKRLDPDIITGYNIFGFDMSYMYDRSRELDCEDAFLELGREHDNLLKFVDMDGRVLIDLMKVVQREHRLESYKLDAVASHFMGMNKNDVSPNDIFRLYKGGPEDKKVVAEYCVQDCALCNQLIIKLEIMANNIGMANVCSVPLSYIFMRGQGVKIFSLVAKFCRENDMMIPVIRKVTDRDADEETPEEEGYEGAIVLPPKKGIYLDKPVNVWDFASLYPSSMISENLSHDMVVIDEKYNNLPGVDYLDVTYDIYEGKPPNKVRVGEKVCRFVQPPDNKKGVIPRILMRLLKARKDTRKKITYKTVITKSGEKYEGMMNKNEEDGMVTLKTVDGDEWKVSEADIVEVKDTNNEFQKAVLDGLQLAFKITANSLYGQIGARTSPIYFKDIAACTTATGRRMILKAKEFMEKEYGAETVYGDSVTGDTPLLIKRDGKIEVMTIQSLCTEQDWFAYREFKPDDPNGYDKQQGRFNAQVWANGKWADIRRVIRHKTTKKLYRVNTFQGCVDVTEDHSLIDIRGNKVKPTECGVMETDIMHYFPKAEEWTTGGSDTPLSRNTARLMGIKYDGSHVPTETLYASPNVKRAFIEGVMITHGKYCCDNKVGALKLYILMKTMEVEMDECAKEQERIVRVFVDRKGVYHITNPCSQYSLSSGIITRSYKNKITKMHELGNVADGVYVYDIETSEGKFHAGVGSMIVSNTDSVFSILPTDKNGKEALMPSIEKAIEASEKFKPLLKWPHDLEYEKTFYPFILFSKKRYVGHLYENDDKKYKFKNMGVVLTRRDNANIVKKVFRGCVDIILNEHSINNSVGFLQKELQKMVDGECPIEDLVITKSLRGDYKNPKQIAHKVLAERMGERDPGNKPQVNDRIPYVYIETKEKVALQGDRVEHPDYIKQEGLKPDYAFYITNQIMNPVLQLYALDLEKLNGYRKGAVYLNNMYKKILRDKEGDVKKAEEKMQVEKEKIVKELLFDPYLNKMEQRKKGTRMITDFFKFE